MSILNNVSTDEETELDTVQRRLVADDITRLTKLAEKVTNLLFSDEENFTDRRGNSRTIPQRPDATSKLGNLLIAALNARSARAGIATSITISENSETAKDDTIARLKQVMRENNYRTQTGQTFGELEQQRAEFKQQDQREPLALPAAPEVE